MQRERQTRLRNNCLCFASFEDLRRGSRYCAFVNGKNWILNYLVCLFLRVKLNCLTRIPPLPAQGQCRSIVPSSMLSLRLCLTSFAAPVVERWPKKRDIRDRPCVFPYIRCSDDEFLSFVSRGSFESEDFNFVSRSGERLPRREEDVAGNETRRWQGR